MINMRFAYRYQSLVVLVLLSFPLWAGEMNSTGVPTTPSLKQDREVKLETMQLQLLSGELRALATIQVDPRRSATIFPRINGWIASVDALPGTKVKKGDTLAVLDGMSLLEAGSSLRQAQAAYTAAAELLTRKKKLSQEEIIPRNELTTATMNYQQALAQLDAAKAQMSFLGLSGKARTVSVEAPFSGTVLSTDVKREQTVTTVDPLFTLSDLSGVLLAASIPESQIRYLSQGLSVRIESSSWPGETFRGTVTSVGGALDATTKTLPVFISVDNPDERLKPEMQVTAFIVYTTQRPVLSVPDSAMTLLKGKPTVFVARGKSIEPVNITLGKKGLKRTEVISGLNPGDRVVIDGAYPLKSTLLINEVAGGH